MKKWKKMAAAAVMMAMMGTSGVYGQAEETEQEIAEADVSDQVALADEMAERRMWWKIGWCLFTEMN